MENEEIKILLAYVFAFIDYGHYFFFVAVNGFQGLKCGFGAGPHFHNASDCDHINVVCPEAFI